MGDIVTSNSHVLTLMWWNSNCAWSVQCCSLSMSYWNCSQSVMLCITLNSLVSSANRYIYEWMISSCMSLINTTKRNGPGTVHWGIPLVTWCCSDRVPCSCTFCFIPRKKTSSKVVNFHLCRRPLPFLAVVGLDLYQIPS